MSKLNVFQRVHARVYSQFLAIKRTGVPQFLVPPEIDRGMPKNPFSFSFSIWKNQGVKPKSIHFYEFSSFLFILSDRQSQEDFGMNASPQQLRLLPLFLYGFFEIRSHMENKTIIANCMTCQRMGRQNLLQAHEERTTNLVAHLKVS